MKRSTPFRPLFFLFLLCASSSLSVLAQSKSALIGSWDLEIQYGDTTLPSWLEVEFSGTRTLIGRYVSFAGSARPIAEVFETGNAFNFSIPPQWMGNQYMHLSGTRDGDRLSGNIITNTGQAVTFTGVRAPSLEREAPKKWSKPEPLFNGENLDGWQPQTTDRANQWQAVNGVLTNPASGVNLMTTQKYDDFKLHVEFKYPAGSNSGIYLRGRYEVQVEDNYGQVPNSHYIGGLYGFLTPNENASKPAGEWQTYDITLVGRRVTVVLNGKSVITDAIIPGITGGALDSKEGEPGPILLQGDHGPIEYRNLTISVPKD
ncbi:MAG: 3-keto-disaccharide hydrolase [Flavobacteriaceae bacterium]